MYIENISKIKTKIFRCTRALGKYIVSKNVPLLNITSGVYAFTYTNSLKEIFDSRPDNLRGEVFYVE